MAEQLGNWANTPKVDGSIPGCSDVTDNFDLFFILFFWVTNSDGRQNYPRVIRLLNGH